jgi:NADH:ubiquinone reductase (H+-translocating)
MEQKPRIVVVGGGFAGVRAMLDLAKKLGSSAELILVSQNPMFEYYPGLHRIVGQKKESLTEIPLSIIFEPFPVTIMNQKVVAFDPVSKTLTLDSGVLVSGDYIVMALGSQTEYFNIKGLNELSFGLKSVREARILKDHIRHTFADQAKTEGAERMIGLHFVVVGGGPAGVDLVGELAHQTRLLAREYEIPESCVTLDLVEAAPRLLPMMSPEVSMSVQKHLRSIGVNVFLNRNLVREGSWTLFFQDMTIDCRHHDERILQINSRIHPCQKESSCGQ